MDLAARLDKNDRGMWPFEVGDTFAKIKMFVDICHDM
jgi:hypothetical protein